RIYPHATFEITTAPNNTIPLLYTVVIPASDIEQTRGVHAVVTNTGGAAPKGTPYSRSDKTLTDFAYDWGNAGNASGTVRLSTSVKVDSFGTYKFDWQGAQGSVGPHEIRVDGYPLQAGQPITLGLGLHSI